MFKNDYIYFTFISKTATKLMVYLFFNKEKPHLKKNSSFIAATDEPTV